MKLSKQAIIILALVFVVLAVAVANLVFCIINGTQIPMAIGIAAVMLGIAVWFVTIAIKDSKKSANGDDDYDDDDDDDDE